MKHNAPKPLFSTLAVEAPEHQTRNILHLISRGDKTPYRLHYRSTGLPLVHAMDTVCRGGKIADLIAIGGTMDFVIPDIDR